MARTKKLNRSTNVGGLLTKRRKAIGFRNAKHFCEEMGIEKSTYCAMEAGHDFKFSTLLKVCKLLKIKPSELLEFLTF